MNKQRCKICGMQFDESKTSCPRCGIIVGSEMPSNPITAFRAILLAFSLALFVVGIIGIKYQVVFGSILLLIIGGSIMILISKGFIDDCRLWKLAKKDHSAFMGEIKKLYPYLDSNLSAEMSDTIKKANETYYAKVPSCPICHSKQHVRRLSNFDRTISTAVWGAASSSIGKQWECTSCNHKFNVDAVAPSAETKEPTYTTQDPAEELRKYKQLLDDGIITQDDFDQKKKQLLGL